MNFIDKAIGYISPKIGAERARERIRFDMMKKVRAGYEGASKGRRTDGWKAWGVSASGETMSGLGLLRNRSRDLVRNNPYAKRAVSVYSANIVGTGIVPTPLFNDKSDSPRAKKLAKLFKQWADKKVCDADGKLTFGAMQSLAAKEIPASGEILIRRKWRRSSFRRNGKRLPVNMQLQILDADYLDVSKDVLKNEHGGPTIQGIIYNADLERVGYWIYNQNPLDYQVGGIVSNFVDAADIIHSFDVLRAGQVRGVPWFAPVILRLRDFDEYEDAQLIRQKIAACFTAFVTDPNGASAPKPGDAPKVAEQIEPGLIELLPEGRSVEFSNPPGVDGYADYAKVSLHAIAAGLNIPYEALAQDLSNVNFSSGRMGWLEFQRQLENWRWHMIIPDICDRVWDWFLEAAELEGYNIQGMEAQWTAPRREMINPDQETRAMILGVRGGLMSQPEAIRQLGDDPERVLAEQVEFNEKLDKHGLVFDTDARKTTQAGLLQQAPRDSGKNANTKTTE